MLAFGRPTGSLLGLKTHLCWADQRRNHTDFWTKCESGAGPSAIGLLLGYEFFTEEMGEEMNKWASAEAQHDWLWPQNGAFNFILLNSYFGLIDRKFTFDISVPNSKCDQIYSDYTLDGTVSGRHDCIRRAWCNHCRPSQHGPKQNRVEPGMQQKHGPPSPPHYNSISPRIHHPAAPEGWGF